MMSGTSRTDEGDPNNQGQAGTSGGTEVVRDSPSGAPSGPPAEQSDAPSNRNNREISREANNRPQEEIPSSNGHSNRGSRACCFCWCCCCSCSWKDTRCLTVKNNEENNARNRDNTRLEILNGENEPPPTLEEIRTWGESFDRLMQCNGGRKIFRDFLKCEYSEENILFWLACEDLKRENNPEVVGEKARLIYEDYVSILSPKEVSLDSRVREVINRNMVEPSPHTFDEAQLQIYTLMHRDSYPRFVNSPMYKKLAQLPS